MKFDFFVFIDFDVGFVDRCSVTDEVQDLFGRVVVDVHVAEVLEVFGIGHVLVSSLTFFDRIRLEVLQVRWQNGFFVKKDPADVVVASIFHFDVDSSAFVIKQAEAWESFEADGVVVGTFPQSFG